MAGNIFINYRREESAHTAGRLHDSLAPKLGRNKLFMDVDNIPIGKDFDQYLKSQVAACDAMLTIIGPNWLAMKDETGKRRLDNPEDYVAIEIRAALARDIPVVPVLVDGARMPKMGELPDSLKLLANRQAVQVRHTNFNSDTETLVKRLREVLGYESPGRRWRVRAIGQCPLWVISGHMQRNRRCPLYTRKRPRKPTPANGHVRFAPESGHEECTRPRLLRANSGHIAAYSRTSLSRV